MEYLMQFLLFFGKLTIVFVFILGLVSLVATLIARQKHRPELEVENINEKLSDLGEIIRSVTLDKKDLKAFLKEKKQETPQHFDHQMFLLRFEGDIHATHVEEMSDEITAILTVAKPGDHTVVVIESSGGTVHGYGLGAAQIMRLKSAGMTVTACIDKVAASGGYMMACVAHKIVAAPFAIVGSIGVLAQVPNVHRLLKKYDVDYEEITAGEYKKTLSILGEITEKGRAKFREQIEQTHLLFKNFVQEHRPQLNIGAVATGEYWFATQAKTLGLVDEISTSDEYILRHQNSHKIFKVKFHKKKKLAEKIHEALGEGSAKAIEKILDKSQSIRFQ